MSGIRPCKADERCVVCHAIGGIEGTLPIARTDDGVICSQTCWIAFMYGAKLLGAIKNFSPWHRTPRWLDNRKVARPQ